MHAPLLPNEKWVEISSTPQGADVMLDGRRVGRTPFTIHKLDASKAHAIEVKRVGEIAGVDQLLRYQERLDRDPQFSPTLGLFVAQQIKPQARVYAESKGVACIQIDLERLRGAVDPDLTLF